MDAARARLVGTLESLSAELACGTALPLCLRRLPRADYQSLCAPLPPVVTRWRRWGLAAAPSAEPLMLARIALAAGAESPEQLANILAQLAIDLREAAR